MFVLGTGPSDIRIVNDIHTDCCIGYERLLPEIKKEAPRKETNFDCCVKATSTSAAIVARSRAGTC